MPGQCVSAIAGLCKALGRSSEDAELTDRNSNSDIEGAASASPAVSAMAIIRRADLSAMLGQRPSGRQGGGDQLREIADREVINGATADDKAADGRQECHMSALPPDRGQGRDSGAGLAHAVKIKHRDTSPAGSAFQV